jgi:hypothetical protein
MPKAEGVPQVVKHLPTKCETLSSNSSTTKKTSNQPTKKTQTTKQRKTSKRMPNYPYFKTEIQKFYFI